MKARVVLVLSLAIALASGGLLFAGGSAEQPVSGGKAVTVAFVVKNQDAEWKALQQGGEQAARDLGNVDVTFQAPDTPTDPAQADIINALISQKVSAIVVAPADPAVSTGALFAALKKASDAGIRVLTLDWTIEFGGPLLVVISSSGSATGASLVKLMASQIGDSGEIGIISAAPDALYQTAVINGMKKELAAHPNIRLDAILYGNEKPDTAGRETATLLKAYPNVKGIIAPTTVGLAAASKALKDAGLAGKVQVTGLGVPADMKPYFDDGTCTQMLLGVPLDSGYAATWAAAQLARGAFKGTDGETLKAGRLGTLAVERAGRLLVPAPSAITKDTIAAFEDAQSN